MFCCCFISFSTWGNLLGNGSARYNSCCFVYILVINQICISHRSQDPQFLLLILDIDHWLYMIYDYIHHEVLLVKLSTNMNFQPYLYKECPNKWCTLLFFGKLYIAGLLEKICLIKVATKKARNNFQLSKPLKWQMSKIM